MEVKKKNEKNLISFVYQFRNKVNALFGDDPEIIVYEVNEPLPDGTIERRDDGQTLNIVSSNVVKLTLLRDYIGDTFENGEVLYIDYYYGRVMNSSACSYVNIANRPSINARLDIAMLFEGNPHFSKLYSGYDPLGPWFCVAFKPELIQYYNEDISSLHGRKSCAMEDIARSVLSTLNMAKTRIYFSTENIEDFMPCRKSPAPVAF